jgi:hypothetical protein
VTPEQFNALLAAGIVGQPVELNGSKWVMGSYEFHFMPEMADDAAQLGINLPTCSDPPISPRVALPPRLTQEQYRMLVEAGVLDTVELLDGVLYMGEFPVMFSPGQVAAAAALGVSLPSPVDAVLADPTTRAELTHRLARNDASAKRPADD